VTKQGDFRGPTEADAGQADMRGGGATDARVSRRPALVHSKDAASRTYANPPRGDAGGAADVAQLEKFMMVVVVALSQNDTTTDQGIPAGKLETI